MIEESKQRSGSAYIGVGVAAGYNEFNVVDGFSFSCEPGEIVGIIGPNGSGKSTLLKRLAGLLHARGGTVALGGQDLTRLKAPQLARLGVRYVPQFNDVFPSLSARDNLIVGQDRKLREARVERVLSTLPVLKPVLSRYAGSLSGGERKLLGIGRALMTDEIAVLLVDEPSAGLGPQASSAIWPAIQEVARSGARLLLVEQQVDSVMEIASRVCVMVGGEKRDEFAASQLRDVDLAQLFFG